MLVLILLAVCQLLCVNCLDSKNFFEGVKGCKQYSTNNGYEFAHEYILASNFDHIKVTSGNVTQLRFGVLGKNDGHIRLSPKEFPYKGTSMHEIVLSGWANTQTVARRYIRTSAQIRGEEYRLEEQPSYGLLSVYKPFMFRMDLHPNGQVRLIRDGDIEPFFQFKDWPLSAKYIGFCSFDTPMVYFYDCPLEVEVRSCEGDVLLT